MISLSQTNECGCSNSRWSSDGGQRWSVVGTRNNPNNAILVNYFRHKFAYTTVSKRKWILYHTWKYKSLPRMCPMGMLSIAHVNHINFVVGHFHDSNHCPNKRSASFHRLQTSVANWNRNDLCTGSKSVSCRIIWEMSGCNRSNMGSMTCWNWLEEWNKIN